MKHLNLFEQFLAESSLSKNLTAEDVGNIAEKRLGTKLVPVTMKKTQFYRYWGKKLDDKVRAGIVEVVDCAIFYLFNLPEHPGTWLEIVVPLRNASVFGKTGSTTVSGFNESPLSRKEMESDYLLNFSDVNGMYRFVELTGEGQDESSVHVDEDEEEYSSLLEISKADLTRRLNRDRNSKFGL